LRSISTERRRSMSYFADLEPFVIRAHNQELINEVSKLRLEKHLRDNHRPRSGRAFAFIFERMKPLPR
jgi:hypothetical protein